MRGVRIHRECAPLQCSQPNSTSASLKVCVRGSPFHSVQTDASRATKHANSHQTNTLASLSPRFPAGSLAWNSPSRSGSAWALAMAQQKTKNRKKAFLENSPSPSHRSLFLSFLFSALIRKESPCSSGDELSKNIANTEVIVVFLIHPSSFFVFYACRFFARNLEESDFSLNSSFIRRRPRTRAARS
ncbi:hypothetical protein BC830DRAFT_72557 [Chytriomyces sp. MP71]|nr:hypothetical protein BC830DRAFT_72557 [Chytriomyces sp. MP71]